MLTLRRRLSLVIGVVLALYAIGTLGYVLIERWPLTEALYMTAITLTTVGFGEVRPLSTAGRLFTIGLLVMGVGTVAYSFSVIGEYLLVAGVGERLRRRRMQREIDRMNGHVIICGYGRVGQTAVETLQESGRPFVILEGNPDIVNELRGDGYIVLEGDATKDEILLEAGIERASGIIICTGSDPDNLFIVLSARTLNPNLHIVVRSSDSRNHAKMKRAGADRVVSPYQIGGRHMANLMIRPRAAEFLDVVSFDSGLELWLEDLVIGPNSALAGHTVVESDLRRRTGVTLVGLVRSGGTTVTPDANTLLKAGDEIIVLGTREQLAQLEELARGAG